jgi:SAM-dependent methyltransferase
VYRPKETTREVYERRVIDEQIDYYRQRASEYDETSTPPGDSLAVYAEQVAAALNRFRPCGDVLEIASGTGVWTVQLLRHATRIVALDSAPEMHERARERVGRDPRVRFVTSDVFSWQPGDRFDLVFFANWLSHVPPSKFGSFWDTVREALRPHGRVFFVDEGRDAWRHEHLAEEFVDDAEAPLARRSLRDGRQYRVVKVFWDRDELKSRLRDLGWGVEIHPAGPFFWGHGRLAKRSRGEERDV